MNTIRIQSNCAEFILAALSCLLLPCFALSAVTHQTNPKNLPSCPKDHIERWHDCWGTYTQDARYKYVGEFKDGKFHGVGTHEFSNGIKYVGEFENGERHGKGVLSFLNGGMYIGEYNHGFRHGRGTAIFPDDSQYVGEFKNDRWNGLGTYTAPNGEKYYGEYSNGERHGRGIYTKPNGRHLEGIWEHDQFIREVKVNLPTADSTDAKNSDSRDTKRGHQPLAEERQRPVEKKRDSESQRQSQRLNLKIANTPPAVDGSFTIDIQTNADTASLLVDGKEEGGRSDGYYTIKRIARAGQTSSFRIVATDVYGNTEEKTVTVTRQVVGSSAEYAQLNPAKVKRQPDRDAVAIIIGIANYKTMPKAEFANDDARVFYDYAIRALGIKPENIKLLVDADAEEVEIIKAFKTWLPSKVKSTTDVYVFYSGHGLPTQDGQGLYMLPPRADRDFISRTSIQFQEISDDIQVTKPKSVTIFMDACYSGQARSGETLVANARPVTLKAEKKLFPDNFTVITASQADQISSSSPDLKHGIFSYYLMKGMEGDADANKDGKITLGEMQAYLVENVGRQAGMMSRKQEPQLIGDAGKVLVGK